MPQAVSYFMDEWTGNCQGKPLRFFCGPLPAEIKMVQGEATKQLIGTASSTSSRRLSGQFLRTSIFYCHCLVCLNRTEGLPEAGRLPGSLIGGLIGRVHLTCILVDQDFVHQGTILGHDICFIGVTRILDFPQL